MSQGVQHVSSSHQQKLLTLRKLNISYKQRIVASMEFTMNAQQYYWRFKMVPYGDQTVQEWAI